MQRSKNPRPVHVSTRQHFQFPLFLLFPPPPTQFCFQIYPSQPNTTQHITHNQPLFPPPHQSKFGANRAPNNAPLRMECQSLHTITLGFKLGEHLDSQQASQAFNPLQSNTRTSSCHPSQKLQATKSQQTPLLCQVLIPP